MEKRILKDLLQRYSLGKCTEEEVVWVENWYLEQDFTKPIPISIEEFEKNLEDIYVKLTKAQKIKQNYNWIKIAAVLSFLTLSIGFYSYLSKRDPMGSTIENSLVEYDVAPGTNKATLTLADGSVILLDQLQSGEVYQKNDLTIQKTKDGEIEYIVKSDILPLEKKTAYNQINTPTGGQYQIKLPDGTKVWLNASSALKYPTSFASSERIVELEGEAYFEVSKSKSPFYVQTEHQRIEVLGTHFNVNAYKDELGTKTTLLEGSVKVSLKTEGESLNRSAIVLKPGEEALLIKNKEIQVSKVNIKKAIAWKNGFFHFEDTDLESVMREFSRWYGVKVQFEGTIPKIKLWGEIDKNVPASQSLNILKYYDLKFKILENQGVSSIKISERK